MPDKAKDDKKQVHQHNDGSIDESAETNNERLVKRGAKSMQAPDLLKRVMGR